MAVRNNLIPLSSPKIPSDAIIQQARWLQCAQHAPRWSPAEHSVGAVVKFNYEYVALSRGGEMNEQNLPATT
jgi:hypothetical protein